MQYYDSVIDLIGNTPLVRLRRLTEGIQAPVLAKVEYLNPGGSVKDRIAVRIIDSAERAGQLRPGGTIVEPTSGNTGVGLALVAERRRYRCVFVCPDKVGEAMATLEKADAAMVLVEGKPAGVLTRQDLLSFLGTQPKSELLQNQPLLR